MTELLNIEQLSVKLQGKTILQQLDLHLNSGDILGLVGASGCGKTTLLNTIAGFARQSSGKIAIAGQTIVADGTFTEAENRHVGMIFQDYALFPHLSVRQNIAFGITKLSNIEQDERIDNLLSLLKLELFADKYIHQLSGGQQQRVAIARALAPQPKLLLLDEPFSNIDARLRTELILEIRLLLKQLNITAIFVTHNKDEVFTFADKMAVMAEGQLLQIDSPTVICQQPNSWQVADFLQLGSWLPCKVSGREIETALGSLDLTAMQYNNFLQQEPNIKINNYCLLLKPQYIVIDETLSANARIEHISLTEQGYHYHLASIDEADDLSFSKLSFYSDNILAIKQLVSLQVKPHELLVFERDQNLPTVTV